MVILDALNLGSTLSVRSFSRLGSAMAVLDFVPPAPQTRGMESFS